MSGPSQQTRALLIVLSVIAGATDVIGYLGQDGLFTNHITGNLVLLARVASARAMRSGRRRRRPGRRG